LNITFFETKPWNNNLWEKKMKKQFNEKNITEQYSDSDEYEFRDKKKRYEDKTNHKGESWRYIERQKTNQRRTNRKSGKHMKTSYDKW
jgi:hypothetical protein